ncbi:aerolysin family beta-barrel pore-forming toxin [Chryseobacterium sp. BIGb0232]|uniref:aerolysin family beta-barrel pore-forming toxin n=1 Tax=Chryseobacterium sp. BIGb0232 TaxID=2940598 RepID=UPI000F474A03|nr:aerolysin family beta-barrel pore-forming toxin [Chryseobacterium sp. BIGb0232]MCS4300604.1 hypothetical protein [Chryseobacterium sp. BIGb0232]ROS20510.1 aerolysin toxin [Chryseobacterium nakagawai]
MKKKYLKFLYVGITVLSIVSCSRADSTSILENEKSTTPNNSITEKELLAQGWTIVKEINLIPELKNRAKTSARSMEQSDIKVPFTEKYLSQMGWDLSDTDNGRKEQQEVIKQLKSLTPGGSYPDPNGVLFTRDFALGRKNIKEEKNWWKADTYVLLGKPELVAKPNQLELPDEVFSTEVTNASNEDSEITVTYSYKTGYKYTWNTKFSGSLKIGSTLSFGIPLTAKGETTVEIMVGGEKSWGEDTTNEKTLTSSYKTKVPANSKKSIKVFTKMQGSEVNYTVPITINGTYVLCTPGYRYEINNMDITKGLLRDSSIPMNEQGVVKSVASSTVKILESPAVKL